MSARYKIGDMVKIKTWNQLCNTALREGGSIDYDEIFVPGMAAFVGNMKPYCGLTLEVYHADEYIAMELVDGGDWEYNDWMLTDASS